MSPDNREEQINEHVSGRRPRLAFSVGTWVVLVVAILFGFAWKLAIEPKIQLRQAVEHVGVGQPLPVLELAPLTGTTESLSLESLRGKVALVNFWGTWCPPCREEFPHMVDLWEEFRGNPEFALVSVSCTQADKEPMDALREETAKFLTQQGTNMPTYADSQGVSRRILDSVIGDFAFPTTVLLDRSGIIRGVWVGYGSGTKRQVERMAEKLLAEKE
jgi:cytochrome c biogenesis protein CcmG, thiol:disulfide interchange protein DsbE